MSTPQSLQIFSLNGFMGNMWLGPQAEVAQHISVKSDMAPAGLGLATWWPVGYDSGTFPLSNGIKSGVPELHRLRQLHPGPYVISAWSEGACVATEYLKAYGTEDLKGGTFYGNPYRAEGQWNPSGLALGSVTDPGGAGVGGPEKNWRTPDSIHHYCHGPNQPSYDDLSGIDQYTCCSVGIDGDVARIFYNFVFTQWSGAFHEIFAVAEDLSKEAGVTIFAMIKCAVQWVEFLGGQCKPHVNYTSHAGAAYLENVARSLP